MALFQRAVLDKYLSGIDEKALDAAWESFTAHFYIDVRGRKLQSWHELTFKQFLKELKKKKVDLTLSEEAEWMESFNQQKAKASELKSQIAKPIPRLTGLFMSCMG